ncbi:MAG: sarcosine oxidase subunit gamma [Boseongicola sp.]
MAEHALKAAPLLGGTNLNFGDSTVVERDDLALVSIATPHGGDDALAAALKGGWSLDMPDPTLSTISGEIRAIRTSSDQMMLVFRHATSDANEHVQGKLDGAGYTTDQTDAWVILEVTGPNAIAALERLCPLDLHDSAFPVNAAGRTVMEHMGAMIVRTGDQSYQLMSASSSAKSFLHAVETSFRWTA